MLLPLREAVDDCISASIGAGQEQRCQRKLLLDLSTIDLDNITFDDVVGINNESLIESS